MRWKMDGLKIWILLVISPILLAGCRQTDVKLRTTAGVESFRNAGDRIEIFYVIQNTTTDDQPFTKVWVNGEILEGVQIENWAEYTGSWIYTVTEEDVAKGRAKITTGVKVGWYDGSRNTDNSDSHSVVIPQESSAKLILEIRSAIWMFDSVNYTFVVTNIGAVNIPGPIVIQNNLNLNLNINQFNPTECHLLSDGLSSGREVVCTVTSGIPPDAAARGYFFITFTANAGSETSEKVTKSIFKYGAVVPTLTPTPTATPTSTPTAIVEVSPALRLDISSPSNYFSEVGNPVDFTYVVTNSGDVVIDGDFIIFSENLYSWECPQVAELAVSESLTCEGRYWIESADIGKPLTHHASVQGVYDGTSVTSPEASVTVAYLKPTPAPLKVNCSLYDTEQACGNHPNACTWDSMEQLCLKK